MQQYNNAQKGLANFLSGNQSQQPQFSQSNAQPQVQPQQSQVQPQVQPHVQPQSQPIAPLVINYSPGQFSNFAMKKERQKIQLAKYIDKIINEAIQSHIGILKQVTGFTDDLRAKSEKHILAIEKYCSGKFDYSQIISRPAYCYANSMSFGKTIVENCKQFMQLCLLLAKFVQTEGFLIKKASLNMEKYIMLNDSIVIPFHDSNNMYLKINSTKNETKKVIVHNIRKQYLDRKGLHNFTRNEQQNIISTITNFLEEKGIIFSKQQIKSKVQNKVANTQQEISKSFGNSKVKSQVKQEVKLEDYL